MDVVETDLSDSSQISASLAAGFKIAEDVGVTRYMQLASLFRHRIATGEWSVGQRLPTVRVLAEDLALAKVTIRQAFAVLVKEGLITSKRKSGTYVSSKGSSLTAGFRSAINDRTVDPIVLSFRVLAKTSGVQPPAAFRASGIIGDDYTLLRRLHVHNGEVFCLSEFYVSTPIFERFPQGSEEKYKVVHLMGLHGGVKADVLRQSMSVEPADIEIAQLLDYQLLLPIAKIRRDYLDAQGNLLLSGTSWYRGDRFVLDMEIPAEISSRYPKIATPVSQPS